MEAPVLDRRLERRVHAVRADRVHVRVEEERAPAARPADDPYSVEPARRHLLDLRIEARVLEPPGDETCDLALPGGARDQVGIDRVDPDQLRDELDDVAACHYA